MTPTETLQNIGVATFHPNALWWFKFGNFIQINIVWHCFLSQ